MSLSWQSTNIDIFDDKIVDVHVWDAETKELKAKLTRFHKRAVVLVLFSPSGKRLLTVGQDDKNSLAVYDWEVGRIAWSSPVDGETVENVFPDTPTTRRFWFDATLYNDETYENANDNTTIAFQ